MIMDSEVSTILINNEKVTNEVLKVQEAQWKQILQGKFCILQLPNDNHI